MIQHDSIRFNHSLNHVHVFSSHTFSQHKFSVSNQSPVTLSFIFFFSVFFLSMAERKVLVKYIHPEFDADKLAPYHLKRREQRVVVRMMLPFTVQCKACGEFIYRGKKFNTRIEEVKEDEYLTIKVYRFYFKCTNCNCECTFKTDPRNSDYACEHGVTRNHEPWKDRKKEKDDFEASVKEEEKDVMKMLENRTENSKQEIEELDHLEEIRDRKLRLLEVTPETLIDVHAAGDAKLMKQRQQEAEDDARALQAFASRPVVTRLNDLESEDEVLLPNWESVIQTNDLLRSLILPFENESKEQSVLVEKKDIFPVMNKAKFVIKNKFDGSTKELPPKKPKIFAVETSGALSALADYDDE